MRPLQIENLSPFGRLALKLDNDFSELDRISAQIERLEIDSDSGLEHAVKLLGQFTQHGENIGTGIQEFAQALQVAREKSEVAAGIVSQRAQEVQARKLAQAALQERLVQLGQRVKDVSGALASLRKPTGETFSDEEKANLPVRLNELDGHLSSFIDEAGAIYTEASGTNLKEIARSAQSLTDTLESARRRLGTLLPNP